MNFYTHLNVDVKLINKQQVSFKDVHRDRDCSSSSAADADPGLRAGSQYRRWDDGLRGDPLVPGTRGHSELDALHADWQDNHCCYKFSHVSWVLAVGALTVCCLENISSYEGFFL